mgnify:CR=1 FL=1
MAFEFGDVEDVAAVREVSQRGGVGRPHHGVHRSGFVAEEHQHLLRGDVPDLQFLVCAAGGEPFAIVVEGERRDVADVAFDPKGRRLAVATYGGVWFWYARIADQKPAIYKWAGSHVGVCWSPDGKFLMSAMQENQLHGWRVADEKNLRMGGNPAKVK